MERAQAGMLAALPGELYAPADKGGKTDARPQLIEKMWWIGHIPPNNPPDM